MGIFRLKLKQVTGFSMVLKYILKVWLTAVLIAPVLMMVLYSNDEGGWEVGNFYALMVTYGFVLSIPGVLLFWPVVLTLVANCNLKAWKMKLTLSIVAFVFIGLSFAILKLLGEYLIPFVCYAITTVAGIWLYWPKQYKEYESSI